MKESEILAISEGRYVKLKKAKNKIPDSFWETYSAFANTDGGIVIFGVDEKSKQVLGIEQAERMRDDLFNICIISWRLFNEEVNDVNPINAF